MPVVRGILAATIAIRPAVYIPYHFQLLPETYWYSPHQAQSFTTGQISFPVVQWTGHASVMHNTLRQQALLVWAFIFNRKHFIFCGAIGQTDHREHRRDPESIGSASPVWRLRHVYRPNPEWREWGVIALRVAWAFGTAQQAISGKVSLTIQVTSMYSVILIR